MKLNSYYINQKEKSKVNITASHKYELNPEQILENKVNLQETYKGKLLDEKFKNFDFSKGEFQTRNKREPSNESISNDSDNSVSSKIGFKSYYKSTASKVNNNFLNRNTMRIPGHFQISLGKTKDGFYNNKENTYLKQDLLHFSPMVSKIKNEKIEAEITKLIRNDINFSEKISKKKIDEKLIDNLEINSKKFYSKCEELMNRTNLPPITDEYEHLKKTKKLLYDHQTNTYQKQISNLKTNYYKLSNKKSSKRLSSLDLLGKDEKNKTGFKNNYIASKFEDNNSLSNNSSVIETFDFIKKKVKIINIKNTNGTKHEKVNSLVNFNNNYSNFQSIGDGAITSRIDLNLDKDQPSKLISINKKTIDKLTNEEKNSKKDLGLFENESSNLLNFELKYCDAQNTLSSSNKIEPEVKNISSFDAVGLHTYYSLIKKYVPEKVENTNSIVVPIENKNIFIGSETELKNLGLKTISDLYENSINNLKLKLSKSNLDDKSIGKRTISTSSAQVYNRKIDRFELSNEDQLNQIKMKIQYPKSKKYRSSVFSTDALKQESDEINILKFWENTLYNTLIFGFKEDLFELHPLDFIRIYFVFDNPQEILLSKQINGIFLDKSKYPKISSDELLFQINFLLETNIKYKTIFSTKGEQVFDLIDFYIQGDRIFYLSHFKSLRIKNDKTLFEFIEMQEMEKFLNINLSQTRSSKLDLKNNIGMGVYYTKCSEKNYSKFNNLYSKNKDGKFGSILDSFNNSKLDEPFNILKRKSLQKHLSSIGEDLINKVNKDDKNNFKYNSVNSKIKVVLPNDVMLITIDSTNIGKLSIFDINFYKNKETNRLDGMNNKRNLIFFDSQIRSASEIFNNLESYKHIPKLDFFDLLIKFSVLKSFFKNKKKKLNYTIFEKEEINKFRGVKKKIIKPSFKETVTSNECSKQGIAYEAFRGGIPSMSIENEGLVRKIYNALKKKNDPILRMKEFIEGMNLIMQPDFDKKIEFFFKIIDTDGNGALSFDEVKTISLISLKRTILIKENDSQDVIDAIDELAEHFSNNLFKMADIDVTKEINLSVLRESFNKDDRNKKMIEMFCGSDNFRYTYPNRKTRK